MPLCVCVGAFCVGAPVCMCVHVAVVFCFGDTFCGLCLFAGVVVVRYVVCLLRFVL